MATKPTKAKAKAVKPTAKPAKPPKKKRQKFDIDAYTQFNLHSLSFTMWPTLWKQYKDPAVLTWDKVPFDASQKKLLPDRPGVYAFIVTAEMSAGLQPSYLLYVGQTSHQTLKERFENYLYEIGSGIGRPKLVAYLPLYDGYTYFHFAEIPSGSALKPKDVERNLFNGFVPPLNSQFEGEVTGFRSAFTAS